LNEALAAYNSEYDDFSEKDAPQKKEELEKKIKELLSNGKKNGAATAQI
jgi:hypothetical protein